MVIRPELPPLRRDRRPEVAARLEEIAYVGTEVRMPADLWRLASEVARDGWTNAEALRLAGWGE